MSQELQELKLYIAESIAGLSTSQQCDVILTSINTHSNQIAENRALGEKNKQDISEMKSSIGNIERVLTIRSDAGTSNVGNVNGNAARSVNTGTMDFAAAATIGATAAGGSGLQNNISTPPTDEELDIS